MSGEVGLVASELLGKGVGAFPLPALAGISLSQIDIVGSSDQAMTVMVTLAVVAWFIKDIALPIVKTMKERASPSAKVDPAVAAMKNLLTAEAKEALVKIEVARGTVVPWIRKQNVPEDVHQSLETVSYEIEDLKKWLERLSELED